MGATLASRLRAPERPHIPGRDTPLEGLRGACALIVLGTHLALPAYFVDPAWAPPHETMLFDLGTAAVFVFFVLSGYVIGLTTRGPATGPAVRRYCGKRFVRLVPLTTIAVLLSWLLRPETELRTVIGNLLFLQNHEPYPGIGIVPLLSNNANLWSLNFELVFYLGFIAIWRWAPRLDVVIAGAALVIVAQMAGLIDLIWGRYACGALYWLAGLAAAWLTAPASPPRAGPWLAAALGAYAIWTAAPLRTLFFDLEWSRALWWTPLSPHRFDFLPAALWLLLAVTGRAPRWCERLGWVCTGICAARLIVDAATGRWQDFYWIVAGATAAALVLLRRPVTLEPLARLAPIGGISFGIYVLSTPFQLGQMSVLPEFSGSPLTYGVRVCVLLALIFAAAWVSERRLAPWFARRMRPR